MKPKLSIIVPVFNTEKYLTECIDSILNQSFREYELILVNDGSTDNSLQICREYMMKDSRIHVIDKTNGGLSSARNSGLNFSTGNFIGFVDSDDVIQYDMFETLYNDAIRTDSEISSCKLLVLGEGSAGFQYHPKQIEMKFNKQDAMRELVTNRVLTFSSCNKIYEKHLFYELRYNENIIFEDMDISYKLIDKCHSISYTEKTCYFYRFNPTSILRSEFSLNRLVEYQIRNEIFDFCRKYYPLIAPTAYFEMKLLGFYRYIEIQNNFGQDKLKEFYYLRYFDMKFFLLLLKNSDIYIENKLLVLLGILSPSLINTYKLKIHPILAKLLKVKKMLKID